MIALRRVLCPVDFSNSSRRALDYASALAGWYGAQLSVLYIVPINGVMDVPAVRLDERERSLVLERLQMFAGAVPSTVPLDLQVDEAAEIHTAILSRAADTQTDLLVLGTHGRSGLRRLMLGSVTERVLRSTPCATLVAPPLAIELLPTQPVRFQHIVCPTDFSTGSNAAVGCALSLAQQADAELLLLHVIEVPPEMREHPATSRIDVDAIRAAAEAEALRRLRELVPDAARKFCTVETAVAEGAADHAILTACAARNADLVVIGASHHGVLDRILFGSVAARVTRAAPCPVLIVPARSSVRARVTAPTLRAIGNPITAV